jgi:thiol-disulfide isomerase/thioredoxin
MLAVIAGAEEKEMVKLPESKAASDVIGEHLPLGDLRFLNVEDPEALLQNGHVKLVRWWTDSCPYCAGSLPAIADLEEKYGDRGFDTIAVYHPKPPRDVPNDAVLDAAKELKFRSAVAVDDDWAVLRRAYLDTGRRRATSVSFLLDGEGRIRYVHPGPELRPSDRPDEADLQAQFEEMTQAIEALLAEED